MGLVILPSLGKIPSIHYTYVLILAGVEIQYVSALALIYKYRLVSPSLIPEMYILSSVQLARYYIQQNYGCMSSST